MDARQARAKAEKIAKENKLKDIQPLLEEIEYQSSMGRFTVHFYIRDDELDNTRKTLQELGYTIASEYPFPDQGETSIRVEW